jgi:hypothetical protein
MITPPGARRYFNDNVLTFIVGLNRACYQRDVGILVRFILRFTIGRFRIAKFYECDVTK